MAVFALLVGIVIVGSFALLQIRSAERDAQDERRAAELEADRAVRAEARVKEQLETVKRAEAERIAAQQKAKSAQDVADSSQREVLVKDEELKKVNEELVTALKRSEREKQAAVKAKNQAEKATARAVAAERASRKRADRLEKEKRKLSTKLK